MKNILANKKEFSERYFAAMTAVFVFIIYLITLAPSVVQIDSGELAAVQATLGIAHPTGYPLFTIAGYLFLKIPLPFTTIFRANILASIWCGLGIFFFIKSVFLILSHKIEAADTRKKNKSKRDLGIDKTENDSEEKNITIISSLCGGVVLAFSQTVWFQSTSVEVYSLQIFLFSLNIFLILRAYYSTDGKIINWLWVSFSLALGFANHMTTLLLLPFITILFFQKEKIKPESFKKILLMLTIFIPVLIGFYLYLPIRSSGNPQINWGNPISLENILRHVSGKQYQVWLFTSFEAAGKQFKYFLADFPAEFGYVELLIGIIGMGTAYKISRTIFYTLLSTFLFSILYSINYDIVDIDSYFLLTYMMFGFFAAFGFYKTAHYLRQKWNLKIAIVISLLISLFPFALNFNEVNQSNVYTFEDYTRTILNSTEPNSIIFSYQWDYFISSSYYFQMVENFRPDITVIDKELLRRSWYYNQLKRNNPAVIKNLDSDISNFLDAVIPFERSENFDSDLIEKYYRTIMTNLISKNIEIRNYYIGLELFQNEMQRGEFSLPEGYQIVPHLLLFKVVKGTDYVSAPDPNFTIRFPNNRNKYIDFLENAVATMLTYRATYELQFNRIDRAKVYIKKVKKDFPNYQILYDIESRIKAHSNPSQREGLFKTR